MARILCILTEVKQQSERIDLSEQPDSGLISPAPGDLSFEADGLCQIDLDDVTRVERKERADLKAAICNIDDDGNAFTLSSGDTCRAQDQPRTLTGSTLESGTGAITV